MGLRRPGAEIRGAGESEGGADRLFVSAVTCRFFGALVGALSGGCFVAAVAGGRASGFALKTTFARDLLALDIADAAVVAPRGLAAFAFGAGTTSAGLSLSRSGGCVVVGGAGGGAAREGEGADGE